MKRIRLRGSLLFAAVVLFAITAHAAQRGPVNILAGAGTTVTATPINASGQYEWTVAATGAVSSVTGTAPITCAPTTGAVTCSITTPLDTPNGGTGVASPTAHDIMIAEGAAAMTPIACANALPLVGNTGADPGCAVLTTPGGGTGRTSFTAHAVLVGEGASSLVEIGPGTSGQPLVSNGVADPSYRAVSLASGSVGITGTLSPTNGGTGVSNPTANAVAVAEGSGVFHFIGPGNSGELLTASGGAADPFFSALSGPTIGAPIEARFSSGFFSGSATLSGATIHTLASITLSSSTEVIIIASYDCTSNDTVFNTVAYGETTNSTASIVNVSILNLWLGPSTTITDAMRVYKLAVTAGSNTYNFLAATSAIPTTTNPSCSVTGFVIY